MKRQDNKNKVWVSSNTALPLRNRASVNCETKFAEVKYNSSVCAVYNFGQKNHMIDRPYSINCNLSCNCLIINVTEKGILSDSGSGSAEEMF
jgi:hypothetical protein